MAGYFDVPEDKITFDSFIKFPVSLFRLMLIDLEAKDTRIEKASFVEKFIKFLKKFYWKFMLSTLALATVSYSVNAVINAEDIVLSSQCILYAITCTQVVIKVLTTLRAKEDIVKAFHVLRSLSNHRVGPNSMYKVKRYLNDYIRLMKIFAGPFLMSTLSAMCLLFVALLFGDIKIAVNFWYPFTAGPMITLYITILWVNLIAWNCSVYLLAVDSLLFALITVLAMEFDILMIDFSELYCALNDEQENYQRVKIFCERHNTLIELSCHLQKIYKYNLAFSLITSSSVICFAAFQLSVAENYPGTYLLIFSFLGVLLAQILLLCFFGQKLIDSSVALSDGIFGFEWIYRCNARSQKQFLFMIQRAQKEIRLTAMGTFNISLETFMRIVSSAYSYFTFMKNIYGSK